MWTFISWGVYFIIGYYIARFVQWYRGLRLIGSQLNKLPGEKGHWLLGNLEKSPGASESLLSRVLDYAGRHGNRAIRLWVGPFRPTALLVHPDVVKLILKTNEPKSTNNRGVYSLIVPWLGDGLFLTKGEKWHRTRRLLTPAFHLDILRNYMPVYNDSAEILMNKWSKRLKHSPTESIEIYSDVSLCTLEIIMRCAFSDSSDVQQSGSESEYIKSVLCLADMIMERQFNVLWHSDWIYWMTSHGRKFARRTAFVHDVAREVVERRKKVLSKNPDVRKGGRLDFLDILLMARDEDGNGLTDAEIRDEVDTFMFAGHDTTASAISWCLYNLAKHPEYQERARQEVDQLIAGRDSPAITWDDLANLPYLTQCIRESLRLIPPAASVVRDLTSPLEVDGVTLLPGTAVLVSIYAVHHNTLVWGDDHMEFKPERFEAENMKTMDPYAFIPFSAGQRNCIGQVFAMHEVKAVVARVLHRFILDVDPKHVPELSPKMVMRAKNGIRLRLKERSTA